MAESTTESRERARLRAGREQVESNPCEPLPEAGSQTPKKLRSKEVKEVKKNLKTPTPFSLPGWISQKAWNGYLEMRKKKKNLPTDHAMKLAIKELEKLKNQGFTPEAVLNQSILNGWTGLFPIKSQANNKHRRKTVDEILAEED
jgi:hypothetical protein